MSHVFGAELGIVPRQPPARRGERRIHDDHVVGLALGQVVVEELGIHVAGIETRLQ